MRRRARRFGERWREAALLASALLFATAPAHSQGSAPSNAALSPQPELLERARAAFENLPEADRIAIQDALVWTGDYASTADGAFGRRTFEAIQAFQRRVRQQPTGILERGAVASLVAAGANVRSTAGFVMINEDTAGLRIGIPQKLLPKRSTNANGGARFQSPDGRVTLDTRAMRGGEEALKDLYERNLAIQTPGRTVSYRVVRPDFFVISGDTAGGRFYTRSATDGEAIRGFSIGYDKALASDLERVVIAVANSFVPFPGSGPRTAPIAEGRPQPPSSTPRPDAVAFSGLAVTPRRVLTAAAVAEACREPLIDGAPSRLLTVDKARGLALLDVAKPRPTASLMLSAPGAAGTGLVMFVASESGGHAVATPAEFTAGDHLVAPLQEGAAGAIVVDRAGAIAGMVSAPAIGTRKVAGLVPPTRHPYVPASDLARFLGEDAPRRAAAVEAGGTRGPGALAAELLPGLARVTCPAGRP